VIRRPKRCVTRRLNSESLCTPCAMAGLAKSTASRDRPLIGREFAMPTGRSWPGRAARGRYRRPPAHSDPKPTLVSGSYEESEPWSIGLTAIAQKHSPIAAPSSDWAAVPTIALPNPWPVR
jgi:hypothetical protein